MTFSSLQPEEETRYLGGFESNRMSDTPMARWVKYLLYIALLVVLVSSIVILAIGIWAHESEYGSRQLSTLIGITLYQVDSYMMIGCGVCIFVITIIGCCGVCTQYKCIMGLHLWLLCFLAVSLFVAGILGYVLIGELESKVRAKMEETVLQKYGLDLNFNAKNKEITMSWDRIQQTFECCGVYGSLNSTKSWHIYKDSKWFTSGSANGSYVPESCCAPYDVKYINQCTGRVDTPLAPPRHGPPVSDVSALNYTLYTEGCFDKLEGYLHGTGIVIGTTAIVVGLFLLTEMVLSICMYRMLK